MTESSPFIEDQNRISVYPNPFSESLMLQNDSDQSLQVRILNAQGQEIANQTLFPGLQKSLNLGEIASGVYVVQYEKAGIVFSRKLVKE